MSTASSYIIPKLGGKVQELNYIGFGCWSPDGYLIAEFRSDKQINLIKRETGEVVNTIELKQLFNWLQDIDWSPKNDKIAFLTLDSNTSIIQFGLLI